ncbi:MAG: HAD family hydrolase [Ktedonobacteraceae bacterium]
MYTLPKAITFDCYGTLIDWESEIAQFFTQRLAEKHITGVDARALQDYWEEVQFGYIQQQYRPYRQVLRDTMKLAFDQFSLPYSKDDVEAFAHSMGQWKPFPDSREAILALQQYVKVVLTTPWRYLLQ